MSLMTRTPALRTALAALAALVAVAIPASATLGLPIALPSASQEIETPVSSHQISASENGADTCNSVYTPAVPVPALPTPPLPLPLPVPVPAVPSTSAAADACLHAGLDGASAKIGADAAGSHVGIDAGAESPVDADQVASDAQETAGEAKGFLEKLVDTLFGWF